MKQPSILAAGAEAATAMAALHARCFPRPWTEASMSEALAIPGTQAWLSLTGNRAAGLVMIRVTAGAAEILTICVDPDHRRGGLGRDLAGMALEAARQSGCTRMILEVATRNTAARRLYSSLGFEKIGLRSGYYPAETGKLPPDDALILSRGLINP